MDKKILLLIDKVAYKHLRTLSAAKRPIYRAMAYIGIKNGIEGVSQTALARDMGISQANVCRLKSKWNDLLLSGDITANLIASEAFCPQEDTAQEQPKPFVASKLGFCFSPALDRMAEQAILSAAAYMEQYGKGARSRTHDGFFS